MPTVNYFWNPLNDNIVREFDDDGNVLADYTSEPDLYGALISEYRDGETYQHHYDAQGNTRALTDDSGSVTDTIAYNASGEVTERTGTTPTPFQFGGEYGCYADQTTGQVTMRRRDYDPPLGRWLSVDPDFGRSYLWTEYSYVLNNSPNLVDPSGEAAGQLPPYGKPPGSRTCVVSTNACQLGVMTASRLFLTLFRSGAPSNGRVPIELTDPLASEAFGIGFAIRFDRTYPTLDCLCCNDFAFIQVYSDNIPPSREHLDTPNKGLPPWYVGTSFRNGARVSGQGNATYYPPGIYAYFRGGTVSMFDRPDQNPDDKTFAKKWPVVQSYEACIVCRRQGFIPPNIILRCFDHWLTGIGRPGSTIVENVSAGAAGNCTGPSKAFINALKVAGWVEGLDFAIE